MIGGCLKEIRIDRVEVTRPELADLADIYSIEVELRIARDYCEAVRKLDMRNRQEAGVADGLVIAALVRYIRCFQRTGMRTSLDEAEIIKSSEIHGELHKYFKNIRDKHIAHSLNVYEQTYVNVERRFVNGILQPFTGVYPGNERVVFNEKDATALWRLIDLAIEVALKKRRILEEEALKFINSLSEDEVKAFLPRKPMDVGPENVEKARRNGPRKKVKTEDSPS
jgi:hypothetical protein